MWSHRGITGGDQAPKCLGKYSGRLIVLGGARCVWDDYGEAEKLGIKADLMVVNDIGLYLQKPFQHWVSLHPDHLVLWRKLKSQHGETVNCLSHSNKLHHEHVINWHIHNAGGYSGLFAAQVALALGYEQIILCGVPQDNSGRFFDPPWVKDLTHGSDMTSKRAFKQAIQGNPELRRCVRSMSGWTKELFGGSFDEILDGNLQQHA